MTHWIGFVSAFVLGLAVGVILAFFLFESRIRFYKDFIEQRLASINRLYSQNVTSTGPYKFSFWRNVFQRRSRSGKD